MKLGLAQINSTVGDIAGNTAKIKTFISSAQEQGIDVLLFPELAVTGYPPEDLLLQPRFIEENLQAVKELTGRAQTTAVYLGFTDYVDGKKYNAGAFLQKGELKTVYHKMHLPNYGVFDEKRYFTSGQKAGLVDFKDRKIGLSICEDLWEENGPFKQQAQAGTQIILNINASPYSRGKIKIREQILQRRARQTQNTIAYVNLVGGQDELVFDGGSMVVNAAGEIIAAASQYKEELLVVDLDKGGEKRNWQAPLEEVYNALVLGIRDYVRKNNFQKVVIGISGGIDSALTAALAVDAVGAKAVETVFMPSQFTSQVSKQGAEQLAQNLKIPLTTLSIQKIYTQYLAELGAVFKEKALDSTEENLQARIRGNLLMALSNKFGWLVLTTGNKSEISVGYCTLYGDMAGGFAVLKDVPKTLVYQLAEWRNAQKGVIPPATIARAPTAELKENQFDQDALPIYPVLDAIVQAYVEENQSWEEIAAKGFPPAIVKKVINMIVKAEYKRRQSPPGPRITHRAFGKDWRVPITSGSFDM